MLDDSPPDPESKTQKKRAMHELRSLGAELVELTEARLAELELPDALREALREARTISAHGGKRRQLQYIGKLMRTVDPGPIRERLALLRGDSAQAAARHQQLERTRARLLEDDAALTAFIDGHPGVEPQALRTLIRNARREQAEGKVPKAFRELFRVLRDAAPG